MYQGMYFLLILQYYGGGARYLEIELLADHVWFKLEFKLLLST